jgi:hypothetical protein
METELDHMAEYIIKLDCGDKDDELPGWIYQEVRDHTTAMIATGIFTSTARGTDSSVRSAADNH